MKYFPSHRRQSGFSLVQMSILLTVGALVMVSMLPGQEAANPLRRGAATIEKLMKIEQATSGFMAAYGRRPCPADGQYGVNTANFGIEAANPGACIGGTPAAPLGPDAGTGNVVAGVVPTKTLGLPDEYAFDDWGRRITYVVDKRATQKYVCGSLQNYPANNGKGGIAIKAATGTTVTNVMAAYISHGADGHGAFPLQGSSVVNRMNTGSIDTDTLANAGVDSSFTYNTTNFTNSKVKKEKTSTYDDITYYADYQKNICCFGAVCASPGFRLDGVDTNDYISTGMAVGDVNGDGRQDLIIGKYWGSVYVLLGSPAGWPVGAVALNAGAGNLIDGITGFRFDGVGGGVLAASDLDGDGKDDIVLVGPSANTTVIWGKSSSGWSATQTVNATWLAGGGNAVNGLYLNGEATDYNESGSVAVGDVNGDGQPDLILGTSGGHPTSGMAAGWTYVVFGGATRKDGVAWSTSQTMDAAFFDPNSDGIANNGFRLDGEAANIWSGSKVAISDINNDGTKDIVIGATYANWSGFSEGSAYVVFGGSKRKNGTDWAASQTLDAVFLNGGGTAVNGFRLDGVSWGDHIGGGGFTTGDVNGDGKADLILGAPDSYTASGGVDGAGSVFVVYGGATRKDGVAWTTPMVMNTAFLNGGGTAVNGFRLDGTNGYEGAGYSLAIGDINDDGTSDVVISAVGGDPAGRADAGWIYVVYGKGSGWSTVNLLNTAFLNGGGTAVNGFRLDGEYANEGIGAKVLARDVTGDGKTDIIIGANHADPNTITNAGSMYVIVGKATSAWPVTSDLGY
jgi:hypothetical protein